MSIIVITGQPIIKSRSFCPNPVVKYGIPQYADSRYNKKLIGTAAWREYWERQIYYCIAGYNTGGMWIPGRYYYYLNFFPISTPGRGIHYPVFVDMDYEFFLLVEKAKQEGYGVICVKARRKGLSFKIISIIDHGMRFNDSEYHAGICGSLEIYAETIYSKFRKAEQTVPPEFRMNRKQDDNGALFTYKMKTDQGMIEAGSFNQILVKTMFANTNVFKGQHLDDCVFEEAGENSALESCYNATKDCFMLGSRMVGTPFVNGTAGGMKESKEFKKMWDNADAHKLLKFWVSRRKIYFPNYAGAENEKGSIEEDIPYIINQFPVPHERVGMQDEKRAEEHFQKELKNLLKGKDRKSFIEFVQNNPGNIKEAFQTFASNHYDTDILMTAGMRITGSEYTYKAYVLDWQKDNIGNIAQPRRVIARLADTNPSSSKYDPEWSYVYITDDGMPNAAYRKLHVAGLDGYNQDRSDTSNSLGAMAVRRCQPKIGKEDDNSIIGRKPVCIYYQRPPRKEMFFEICLKISFFYKLTGDVLCDAMSDHVIEYFKNNGGERFLAKRPRAFESEKSEQTHLYGIKFTGKDTRPRMEGLIQSDIIDNGSIWEFPQLIQDCLGYNQDDGERNDKDLHDAHGMSIMQEVARKINPHKESDINKTTQNREMNEAYYDAQGNIRYRPKQVKSLEDMDEFNRQIIAMSNRGRGV